MKKVYMIELTSDNTLNSFETLGEAVKFLNRLCRGSYPNVSDYRLEIVMLEDIVEGELVNG